MEQLGKVYWTQKLAEKLDFAGTSMFYFFECSALRACYLRLLVLSFSGG